MGDSTHRIGTAISACLVALAVLFAGGCAGTRSPASYRYFADPAPDDPWSRKISNWQRRELGGPPVRLTAVAGRGEVLKVSRESGDLRSKYDRFRLESRRSMARELAVWVQDQARDHYVVDGPIDSWATLDETLRSNGDDCDGLELLAYNLLRDLGFGEDEVYRAVVYRRSDGQHHMVTLWFEDEDPWVIDPTGAMTSGMPRMSQVPGWVPLKVFSEDREFSPRLQPVASPAPR